MFLSSAKAKVHAKGVNLRDAKQKRAKDLSKQNNINPRLSTALEIMDTCSRNKVSRIPYYRTKCNHNISEPCFRLFIVFLFLFSALFKRIWNYF